MRIAMLLLFVAILCATGGEASAQIIYGNPSAIDGDTLDFGGERVRLFGIDAPERSQTCQRASVAWRCGDEATALLASLIEGQQVTCEYRSTDRFGRTVAICKAGPADLAETIVRAGYAVALEGFTSDYVGLADQARAAQIGLWAGTFEEPAAYRARDPSFLAELAAYEQRQAEERRHDGTRSALVRSFSAAPYYRNCNEARAAGAAPLRKGWPGYRKELDGDGDGIACEPFRPR